MRAPHLPAFLPTAWLKLALVWASVLALALALEPAQAMPPEVRSVVDTAEDDPTQALQRLQQQAARARNDEDLFWWHIGASRVLSLLERSGQALDQAGKARALLDRIANPAPALGLWLALARIDAAVGTEPHDQLLRQTAVVRQQAQAAGQDRLACEATDLETWLLHDVFSDDEAWLMAEALERCGQALGLPARVASAQIHMASIARNNNQHGALPKDATAYLDLALSTLGERPARYLRSVIEWEAAISLQGQGHAETAMQRLRNARRLSVALQDDAGVAAADLELAQAMLDAGRHAEMLPLLDEAEARLAASSQGGRSLRSARALQLRLQALAGLRRPEVLAVVAQAEGFLAELASIDATGEARAQLLPAMAEGLASQGRHAQAYNLLAQAGEARREIRRVAQDTQILRLQTRYDVARRDAENAALTLRNESARLELQAQTERSRTLMAGLVALGMVCVLAISYARRQLAHRHRMAELALRDELTGQPNRRAVRAYAQEQVAQSLRLGLPLTIAMIDFDHFKQINDQHGHGVGDSVLKTFAIAAGDVLRGQDRLGRWGGEEWLLVMPGTRLQETAAVFERLRERFAHLPLPGLPDHDRCSFSMGAATLGPDGSTVDDLIEAADEALYRAKAQGRDRLDQGRQPAAVPA